MKTAIIKICPEAEGNDNHVNLQDNGVPKMEIIDCLTGLIRVLAQQLVEEARQHVGDNPDAQAKWIDMQRQKPNSN